MSATSDVIWQVAIALDMGTKCAGGSAVWMHSIRHERLHLLGADAILQVIGVWLVRCALALAATCTMGAHVPGCVRVSVALRCRAAGCS